MRLTERIVKVIEALDGLDQKEKSIVLESALRASNAKEEFEKEFERSEKRVSR